MKKIGLLLFVALFWIASAAFAEGLKVGEKAPDFILKDSTGKEDTLESPEF